MKGVIFLSLRSFVEETAGMAAWDACLEALQPPSEGIYVGPADYQDAELLEMVGYFSQQLELPVDSLLRAFGEYLLPKLIEVYPDKSIRSLSAHAFLSSVGSVIHEEVNKLWPDARPPCIRIVDSAPDMLRMHYH